jgi:hypothetical protein
LIELAIATSIPMSEWESAEQILTAVEILKERKNGN